MHTLDFKSIALSFFPKKTLVFFDDGTQFGFNNYINKDIKRIGYSVNLTPDIIEQAKNNHIDLILTHHNIWEDHFELREDCLKLLKEQEMIHFFNHLPLDSMPFGPTGSFAKELDLKIVKQISEFEGFYFGVVGEFNESISFHELVKRVEKILGHKVRVWKNHDRLIKTMGVVSGSGKDLESLHEAHLAGCDAYITGEKSLTTILYANHIKLNFILGSHTFMELGGIRAYATLIQEKMKNVEIIELKEQFIE